MTGLLVFELKSLKLLDSINWCKSINFFGLVLIYGRTKLRLLYRCHVCCNFFLSYPLAFVAFVFLVAFFDDIEWRNSVVISAT